MVVVTNIPPTAYVAVGALVASLVAGFFSFLNLVSSKENKVSEFRLAWIDGLREEIAGYTASIQELVRVEELRDLLNPGDLSPRAAEERELEWLRCGRDAFKTAVESLTKIQLRLNPVHVKEMPQSPEADLMRCIRETRHNFNIGKYELAYASCDEIRSAAAPLLKSTWDLVKNGESGYRKIRTIAQWVIVVGLVFIVLCASGLIYLSLPN